LTDQRKLLSYSDPEGMLEEIIKRQTFIFLKLLSLFKELHASKEVKENALESEGKSCRPGTKPQKINTRAMTSHCETSRILKITSAQSNIEPSRA